MVTSRKPSKRPSMFEVAKLAGVSHQTVSRVINDSPDVSDATRARVQAAIDQLGYRPSNSARAPGVDNSPPPPPRAPWLPAVRAP